MDRGTGGPGNPSSNPIINFYNVSIIHKVFVNVYI